MNNVIVSGDVISMLVTSLLIDVMLIMATELANVVVELN